MDGTQPLLGKMFSKKRTEKEEIIRLTSCIQGPQVDWSEIMLNMNIFIIYEDLSRVIYGISM